MRSLSVKCVVPNEVDHVKLIDKLGTRKSLITSRNDVGRNVSFQPGSFMGLTYPQKIDLLWIKICLRRFQIDLLWIKIDLRWFQIDLL